MSDARDAVLRTIRGWDALALQLGAIPLPVYVADADTRVLWGTQLLSDWTVEALARTTLADVVVEAGREGLRKMIRATADDGRPRVVEVAIPPPGATAVTPDLGVSARLALSPLARVDDGGTAAILVIAEDITALRREEARLRQRERLFVDTQGVAHFGVWEWNPTQPSATWSDELYRIYGLDPSHTPTYDDYLARVHPDDRARVAAATEAAFHHHARYSHDERIYRGDGELRHLHTWAEPVLDSSGKLLRLVGVCQDVTERALAEEERDWLRDQLLEETRCALRVRDDFVAVAAHELRTPLTPLLGHLQLLRKGIGQSAEGSRFVASADAALKQAKRLIGLMDLLLDVSRIRQGKLELERQRCDLCDVVRDLTAALEADMQAAGCALRLDLEGPVVGMWDRVRVEEVVTNLLSNAIKFGRGEPIEVSARVAGDRARVAVTNHGPPIDPGTIARIFRPYERGAPLTHYPGLGLGLYIAMEIARAHGGSITVESASPDATTFVVDLPREAASAAVAA